MSNSNCPGITDPVNAGNIAIDAIFLIGGAVVFCAWFVMRLASIRNKSILKWYLYGFAVIFYCLYVPTPLTDAKLRLLSARKHMMLTGSQEPSTQPRLQRLGCL